GTGAGFCPPATYKESFISLLTSIRRGARCRPSRSAAAPVAAAKREAGASRRCPRNCKRRAFVRQRHWSQLREGQGRGVDPRARRPAPTDNVLRRGPRLVAWRLLFRTSCACPNPAVSTG